MRIIFPQISATSRGGLKIYRAPLIISRMSPRHPSAAGRPRVGERVVVRLPDDLTARIDRLRGDVPRAAYLRTLLEIALAAVAPARPRPPGDNR